MGLTKTQHPRRNPSRTASCFEVWIYLFRKVLIITDENRALKSVSLRREIELKFEDDSSTKRVKEISATRLPRIFLENT